MNVSEFGNSGRIARDYVPRKKLGSGAFGEIFVVSHATTDQKFAVKVEKKSSKHNQLSNEYKIYREIHASRLERPVAVPKVYHYESSHERNFLIMDLLGSSIEDLLVKCNRSFSIKTVLMLGIQMLETLTQIHSLNYLHRDLKPDNFLMGIGENKHRVFLVDFGLAKKYIDSAGRHIPYREGKGVVGTARYASLNTHLGFEQSRRDDLECLGFMLVYMVKGVLPWMNLRCSNKKEKYERIKELKLSTPIATLCKGLPSEIVEYFDYVRKLSFAETPDYVYVQGLLNRALTKNYYTLDYQYDWCSEEKATTVGTEKSLHEKHTKEDISPIKAREDESIPQNLTPFLEGITDRPSELHSLFRKKLSLPHYLESKIQPKDYVDVTLASLSSNFNVE
eukprot:TRINITY_DN7359_c0_g2_i3.p1 TRINITY_DN7359_c0_g2~~TRINITY_DN7359_c0_g2_i3.p1  ORF type:complete len:393 (-),score=70.05 TRINITY_DN7359_c0_g2_i3:142-1320(-)